MTCLPTEINTLANSLTTLNLTRNDLLVLPDALFELTKLTALDLSDNHLFVIPASIAKLAKLQRLLLSKNWLERLPVQLTELTALQELPVDNNPLVYPPPAVCKRGMAAIIGHMRDGLVLGSVTNNKVKAMLLGDGEAGKTSFLQTLIARNPQLQRVGDRTIGIECSVLQLKLATGLQVRVNFLDFAGQDQYQITHQLFLDKDALYIVLVDLAAYQPGEFERQVLRWLQMAQQAQPDAKVVLVGTKVDLLTEGQVASRCQDIIDQIQQAEKEEVQRFSVQLQRVRTALEVMKQMASAGQSGVVPRKSSSLALNMLSKVTRMSRKTSAGHEQHLDAATVAASVKTLEARAERLRLLMARRLKLPTEVVAVNCRNMNYMHLQGTLKAALEDKSSFAQLGEKVPMFYEELQLRIDSRKTVTPSMPWEKFMGLGIALQAEMKLEADQEMVLRAAQFQHDVAEIWYKDEGALKETVFLSLPWIITCMKLIFRHDLDESLQYDSRFAGMSEVDFDHDKLQFVQRGVLSLKLLDGIWSELQLPVKTMASLMDMLTKFGVAITLMGASASASMLVPSLLLEFLPPNAWPVSVTGQLEASRWMVFNSSYMPAGLMERLQVRLYELATRFEFAKEASIVHIGSTRLLVKLMEWEGRKGVQVCVRCDGGSNKRGTVKHVRGGSAGAPQRMWRYLQHVLDLLENVLLRWPGLVPTALVPWDTLAVTPRPKRASQILPPQSPGKSVGLVLFTLDQLRRAQAGGASTIRCSEAEGNACFASTGGANGAEEGGAAPVESSAIQGVDTVQGDMAVEILLLIGEKEKEVAKGSNPESSAEEKEEEDEAYAEDALELEEAVEIMRRGTSNTAPDGKKPQKSHGQVVNAEAEASTRVLAFRRLTAKLQSAGLKWCMLSYPWAEDEEGRSHQAHAMRVYMALVQRRVPVWMDVMGGMSGDVNVAMAMAVHNAMVVLPSMSTSYERSTNCKRELTFADTKKVPIVPMIVEPQYQVLCSSSFAL
jgi:GTPase SAR1 family protein